MDKAPIITMVYPANISAIWHEVEPLLIPAIDRFKTFTSNGVYERILGGNAQLWVQWEDKVIAAVVTEFKPYELGVAFNLWLGGALEGGAPLWKKFLKVLCDFAKKNKCTWVEDCGRDGWDHLASDAEKIGTFRRITLGVVQ